MKEVLVHQRGENATEELPTEKQKRAQGKVCLESPHKGWCCCGQGSQITPEPTAEFVNIMHVVPGFTGIKDARIVGSQRQMQGFPKADEPGICRKLKLKASLQ